MPFFHDELVPPSWLDKKFIEMVLKKYENDSSIVVDDLQILPGTEKGDHFCSVMFRVVASYSGSSSNNTKSRSMMVKTIPEEQCPKKESIEKTSIFETEIGLYTAELPKFENVLRKHGQYTQLCAKVLYHSLHPRKVIVFEDLVSSGYTCIRHRYLEPDEAKLCVSKIAKWHAVSYKLLSEGDTSGKKYQEGLLSMPKEELVEWERDGLNLLIETISEIEELKNYTDRLKEIEPTLLAKCNDIFNASKSGAHYSIMVLNHGDLHDKNVMFKYDEDNKVEDVMLVDMQLSCFGPAAIDLICCIQLLFDADLRKNHREEMIEYYFTILSEILRNIQFDGQMPKLEDLYKDIENCKEFELWLAVTPLPLMCALISLAGKAQTDDLIQDRGVQIKMYSNPDFIEQMKFILPRYFGEGD